MNCPCHQSPMYWNIDKRCRSGGFWECRERRREHNAKRLKVFGATVYVPDAEIRDLAIKLREDRRNGRTND